MKKRETYRWPHGANLESGDLGWSDLSSLETQDVCYIEVNREPGYCMQLKKEVGLLHTDIIRW